MKKIDLNNTSDLRKFKDSLSTILENRITELELQDKIESIDNMSFGDMKTLFENISVRLYESADGQKLIGKYTNTIKNSKPLRNVYSLFESIKDTKYISNPQMFLNEAISLSKISNKKAYDKDLSSLAKIVKECVKLSGISTEEIDNIISSSSKTLNEAVDYVVKNNKSLKNLREYVENSSVILNHFNANMETTERSVNEASIVSVEDINKMLGEGLEPWESELVGAYVVNALSNGDKGAIFEHYKAECINIINESLDSENNVEKAELTAMKNRLEEMSFNENTIVEDLINIADLKHTLSE